LLAEGGELVLRTTDLEISIQCKVAALIEDEGETVVPGRLFTEIIKSLPDSSINIKDDGSGMVITCGESSFSINTLNPLDYPVFPTFDVTKKITINARDLQTMVRKTLKAVSRDESRPVLTGVLMKVGAGLLHFVATDSYRLAITKKAIQENTDFEIIVPGQVLEEISRLAASADDIVISESENQIIFEVGNVLFISRKIEGMYPNYEVLVPQEKSISATANTAELLTTIKRVSITSGNHGPVKLTIDPDIQKITISSKTMDVASATEKIGAQIEGEYLETGFNHQYIIDGISVIDTDEVLFESQGALKPGVLKTSGEEDFLYLTMPVRIDL
jgi:DNA polymerase-3 subunit beta